MIPASAAVHCGGNHPLGATPGSALGREVAPRWKMQGSYRADVLGAPVRPLADLSTSRGRPLIDTACNVRAAMRTAAVAATPLTPRRPDDWPGVSERIILDPPNCRF
jgi:hypothetical protein